MLKIIPRLIAYSNRMNTPILREIIIDPRVLRISYSTISTSFSWVESESKIDWSPNRLYQKDWLAPSEVLQIVRSLRDPESVMDILEHISKRKDYKPSEVLYTLVVQKLAQARMFDAIGDILKRIKAENNCRVSDDFFYLVIKIYGNVACHINRAIDTLFGMREFNCWPSTKTFNFVLNLLVSTKQFDVIHAVYAAAPRLGITIDTCCLNILMKGLCECGEMNAAFALLEEYPKQDCSPNVRTYSTLMHGLCEQGRVDEAFGLCETMEKEGCDPDTITFNILIAGLRKQGRLAEGMELLDRMKVKGCDPNAGSYQEVLYGLLKSEKFVEAKCFMDRMISEYMFPSFVSYKLVIYGLCKENLLEDVDLVLKQMVRQGFVPKMGMWKRILQTMFSRNSCHCLISYGKIIENCEQEMDCQSQ